jgi:predicted HicB family RNase H-like nuclease
MRMSAAKVAVETDPGAESISFDEQDDWTKAYQTLRKETGGRGYKARKKTEKKIRATATGRSLAETGRTKQFNFKALPEVHRAVTEAAEGEGITISEWMEKIISQALNLEI